MYWDIPTNKPVAKFWCFVVWDYMQTLKFMQHSLRTFLHWPHHYYTLSPTNNGRFDAQTSVHSKRVPVTIFFLKIFWRTQVLFVGPLITLFWTSGDIYPGFQCQGGSLTCLLCHLHAMDSSDLPLVWHLLTSWQPAWQPVVFPTCM